MGRPNLCELAARTAYGSVLFDATTRLRRNGTTFYSYLAVGSFGERAVVPETGAISHVFGFFSCSSLEYASMHVTLMHTPSSGDAEHSRKQLTAALVDEGHVSLQVARRTGIAGCPDSARLGEQRRPHPRHRR